MTTKSFYHKHARLMAIVLGIIVVAVATAIIILRYRPAFSAANFYAEDGKIFTNNILHKNVISATLSGFNGYLIIGEYFLLELAVVIYRVLGLHFYELASVIALVSCTFMGVTVALPFLLFRRQLGNILALILVILGACVPIPTFDYAVIGTVGNLKFIFLYWAFVLIIYRNLHARETRRLWLIDGLLLVCTLTNVLVVCLLPFLVLPYWREIITLLKTKQFMRLVRYKYLRTSYFLALTCLTYVAVVYLKGIPKLPGYLDTPYQAIATVKLLYRVTLYAFLYPITGTMRDGITLAVLLGLIVTAWKYCKADRTILVFTLWAIAVATVGFTINRPGISSYLLTYGPTPDQFFYTQSLLFLFGSVWLLRNVRIAWTKMRTLAALALFGVFLWWSVPYGSSFGRNQAVYADLGTARTNVQAVCRTPGANVTFQIYPAAAWNWTVPRTIACK